jgi:pheromone shutdown protein TraB
MSGNIYLVGVVHPDIDGATRMNSVLNKIKPDIIAIEWDSIRDASYANINPANYPSLEEIITVSKEKCRELEQLFTDNKEYLAEVKNQYSAMGINFSLSPKQISLDIVMSDLINNYAPMYLVFTPKQHVQLFPRVELHFIDLPHENLEEIKETYEKERDAGIKANVASLESIQTDLANLLNGGMDNYLACLRKKISEDYDKEASNELFQAKIRSIRENGSNAYSRTVFDSERDKYMGERIRELAAKNQRNIIAFVGLAHLLSLCEEIKDLNPKVMTLEECASF